jgi:hypothetical protein
LCPHGWDWGFFLKKIGACLRGWCHFFKKMLTTKSQATASATPLLHLFHVAHGALLLPWFDTLEANELRCLARGVAALVRTWPWTGKQVINVSGSLTLWRTCFPRALVCRAVGIPHSY